MKDELGTPTTKTSPSLFHVERQHLLLISPSRFANIPLSHPSPPLFNFRPSIRGPPATFTSTVLVPPFAVSLWSDRRDNRIVFFESFAPKGKWFVYAFCLGRGGN